MLWTYNIVYKHCLKMSNLGTQPGIIPVIRTHSNSIYLTCQLDKTKEQPTIDIHVNIVCARYLVKTTDLQIWLKHAFP